MSSPPYASGMTSTAGLASRSVISLSRVTVDFHNVDPVLRLARLAVDQLDDREPVIPVGGLEVLRRQVDVHQPGEVAAAACDGQPQGVSLSLRQPAE